jgi:hypothetical protein
MAARKFHGKRAEEILENIVRLAELLDDEALKQVADLPFIELAKAVSINGRKPQFIARKNQER